jgi:hypothetical protein
MEEVKANKERQLLYSKTAQDCRMILDSYNFNIKEKCTILFYLLERYRDLYDVEKATNGKIKLSSTVPVD